MKINALFFLLLALLLAGCTVSPKAVKFDGKDNYQVTYIGDIHFDGAEYHAEPLTERAQKLHFTQWKGTSQKVLGAAASQSKESAFIIQLGDMIQGDCDNAELQGNAIKDAFALLKKFFPDKKVFSLIGNHEYRGKRDASQAPEKYLIPLLKKELGSDAELDGTNYAVKYGRDLYIFCDLRKNNIYEFTRNVIENTKDIRHIFFCSHLPMYPCSIGNPGWVVPGFKELIPLLAKHKAIIINAHTHSMNYIVYQSKDGILPQITVTSMGREWLRGDIENTRYKSFNEWKNNIKPHFFTLPRYKWSIENLNFFKNEDFLCYLVSHLEPSGFVKLQIDGEKVTAHIYIDNSDKPAKSIILKDNKQIKLGVW